jgi:16S rRNA (adenine1518-N6/adenine1519-N6)-dimethyltransferase
VIRLVPRVAPPPDLPWIERVVRAGFGQRRKTLGKALAAGLGAERAAIEAAMRGAGFDPGARAEVLAPPDFVRLARALGALRPASDLPPGSDHGA